MRIHQYFIVASIPFILFILGCNGKYYNNPKNEKIAQSFIKYWDEGDIENLISLFSDSCLYEEVATGRKYSNKDGISGYAESTLSGVPDSKFKIITIVSNEKMSVVEWIWKGTNSVGWPSMGIPATNKYFEVRGVSVMIIEDNLIMRNSDYWDWNTFLKGIGVRIPNEV
jgi:steroid delta-isomerase-like uncharacterized protein